MAAGTSAPLLTPSDVAKRLGVTTGTVYRWIRSSELPHVTLGNRTVRIDAAELDRWLADRRAV